MSLFNRRKKPIIVTIHGFGRNLSHEFDPLARYLKARKYEVIGDKVNWHLIGTLQTNKVKYIIDKVTMIHSLDREALCEEIQKRAPKDILNELKETICDDLDNFIKCKDLNIEVKIEWKFVVAFQLS